MREIINGVLHVLLGLVLAGLIMWNYWMGGPVLLIFGWLREQAQHREQGFFGWMTAHRLFEAVQWGIGGAIGSVIYYLVLTLT